MSRRVLLGAAVTAVVLVAAWALLLWVPQGRKVADAQTRQETAAQGNQALELRLARLRALDGRRPALDAESEELGDAVPTDPRLGEFLLDLDEAAVRAGVSVTSVTPADPTGASAVDPAAVATTGPAAIPVAIQVDGGYFEVLDYINRLEDLPRVVVVDGVTLTSVEDESGGTTVNAALTTRIFTATEAADAAAGSATTTPEGAAADGGTTTTTAPTATDAGGAT